MKRPTRTYQLIDGENETTFAINNYGNAYVVTSAFALEVNRTDLARVFRDYRPVSGRRVNTDGYKKIRLVRT